jgi:hypothetical protein
MIDINLTKELTEADLNHLFSCTKEYSVEKIRESTFKIHYTQGLNGHMDTIIYQPTLQTILRQLKSMHYLEGYEQKEAELKKQR